MPKQNNNNKKYSHKSMEIQLEKPHFVFIHGVGGGSWCWYKVKCLMKSYGYTVTCLDLKSAGIDPSDPNKILSFDDYNKPLIDFLSSLSDHEHVILVGHSAGGLSVTDATRKFPNKIRLAVYVAATMLKSGFLTEQDIKDGVPDVSEYGDVYDLEFGLGPDKPPTSAIVKKELQQKVIYHMSPQEDVTLATMLLKPGPLYAFQSAQFREENEGAEKVARLTESQSDSPQQESAELVFANNLILQLAAELATEESKVRTLEKDRNELLLLVENIGNRVASMEEELKDYKKKLVISENVISQLKQNQGQVDQQVLDSLYEKIESHSKTINELLQRIATETAIREDQTTKVEKIGLSAQLETLQNEDFTKDDLIQELETRLNALQAVHVGVRSLVDDVDKVNNELTLKMAELNEKVKGSAKLFQKEEK
ncbi:hypothetical protein CTI12_AA021270 [Artemisia annua]|uniref:AB hydrolase-1 domain-containing protein n=1 Tax=Artemisia annua TaxID=35608 RepID=A0A2U1QJX8_ARTAN|nr:hypothetical protein CTI12_AA021270 [Artemisia annua]